MLKIITMLTLLATAMLAKAQVTENRNLAAFQKIEITDAVELAFTQSTQSSLTAEAATAAELANLITEVKDNTLYITTTVGESKKMKVYLSAQGITSIKGGSNVMIALTNELQSNQLKVSLAKGAVFSGNISNKGKMMLELASGAFFNGNVVTDALAGNFSGNSKANLGGQATKAKIEARSGAICDSKTFSCRQTLVYASGFASVLLNPDGESDIAIAGNAEVRYCGTPDKAKLQDGLVLEYKKI